MTPVVSAIFTVAIIELGFVIFHPIPYSIENNMYFEADPFTGYRLKPNSIGHFQQGIPARTNENGHRDDAISAERTEGASRILVLGDSFTVGANVTEHQAYVAVLEMLLSRSNTSRIEVINAGVGGWGPFQYAQYYEHYGWKFSPDLILIGFFVGNDTYDQLTKADQLLTAILGRRISREAKSDRFIRLKVFMYYHSNIARLVMNRGPTHEDTRRQNCSDFSDQYLDIQHSRLHNHLKRTKSLEGLVRNSVAQIKKIKKLAGRDSIPLSVVLIPDENQINRKLQSALLSDDESNRFDFGMPQSMLKELFADAGIPVIDLLPYYQNDSRCLYMNDTHWTAEGHALAAAIIYKNIASEKFCSNLASIQRMPESGAAGACPWRLDADKGRKGPSP